MYLEDIVLHECLTCIQALSCAQYCQENLVKLILYLGHKIFRLLVLSLTKFPQVRQEPTPQSLGVILPNASLFPQKLTGAKEECKEGQLHH